LSGEGLSEENCLLKQNYDSEQKGPKTNRNRVHQEDSRDQNLDEVEDQDEEQDEGAELPALQWDDEALDQVLATEAENWKPGGYYPRMVERSENS
jgi:hypothetical protein